jgi:hypothetical protein
VRNLAAIALAVPALMLFGAVDASARVVVVTGQVLAPSASAGPAVSVPVLLTPRAERRLGVGTPVVRLLVRRRARVAAPQPFGSGHVKIAPSAIRAGDGVLARIRVRPALRRRARKQAVPSLRVRSLRVNSRSSALTTDELAQLMVTLQAQLAVLAQRMDQLAAAQGAGIPDLQQQIDAVQAGMDDLATQLAAVEETLQDLLSVL